MTLRYYNITTHVAKSESFKNLECTTQCKVSIITKNGNHYLEFDNNFKTENGFDLVIILYSTDTPPT